LKWVYRLIYSTVDQARGTYILLRKYPFLLRLVVVTPNAGDEYGKHKIE